MAIILPPSDNSDYALEATIITDARPALLVKDGRVQLEEREGLWADRIEQSHTVLEKALRGVGRIETDSGPQTFVGTAFLVDSNRAVTAGFVAEALLQHRPPRSDADPAAKPKRLAGVWLNLKAENGSEVARRIAVRDVQLVHPYWGFAFLILDSEVEPDCILKIASKQPAETLRNQNICVLGYPALDVRNDPDAMQMIFRGIFDVKRVMPGKITGMSRWGAEDTFVLNHDATTMGGTSGAPLIELKTGDVVGLQLGGEYLVGNYAIPAWEIARDPQWWTRTTGAEANEGVGATEAARQSIGLIDTQEEMLQFEEVLDFHKKLTTIGVDDDMIQTLLSGLPPEYVGALPQGAPAPGNRLLTILHEMNVIGGRIGKHSAFYYVFSNAVALRSWDTNWVNAMQGTVTMLLQREAARGWT